MAEIRLDRLATEIATRLTRYNAEVTDEVNAAMIVAAKQGVKKIRQYSPQRTKKYSKSWKIKTEYVPRGTNRLTLYNKKYYWLTHLLEHGHADAGGGRVEGRPHVSPAEDDIRAELLQELERRLGSGAD